MKKKNRIKSLTAWIITLCLLSGLFVVTFPKNVYADVYPVIVLDPGHDSTHARGANRSSGIVEENMNLAIAKALKAELVAAGYTVYMTRTGTGCAAGSGKTNAECLQYRTAFAAKHNCDLYISLHCNASGSNNGEWRSANGSSIYISGYSGYKTKLASLAGSISKSLKNSMGLVERSPKGIVTTSDDYAHYSDGTSADFYKNLRNTTFNGIPSILIEHGFMDNRTDSAILKNTTAVGKADAKGIIDWIKAGNRIEKTSAPSGNNSKSGIVSSDILNIRKDSSASVEKVYTLKKGAQVYIYGEVNGFYKIVALENGIYYDGFAAKSYIKLDSTVKHPKKRTVSEPEEDVLYEYKAGYVNYEFLNLRKSNTTKSDVVVKLSGKDPVIILKTLDGWYQVKALHGGRTYSGYVSAGYITLYKKAGIVNNAYLNVRSGRGTSYTRTDRLSHAQKIYILSEKDGWYRILYYKDGLVKRGYAAKRYISLL